MNKSITPVFAFLIAAVVQIGAISVLIMIRPDKAGEMAVPFAIIVCGLAGPALSSGRFGAAIVGGLLGLLNCGAFMLLARLTESPDKLTAGVRIAASIAFSAATALATSLWAAYARQSRKS